MLSVGGLAAIINVCTLLTVAIADRALELIVRNFATSRLQRFHRAPVVHDSDTWLPNLPRSIVKYHRHPAILATILCTAFLISSELITELGVDVSELCSPKHVRGMVTTSGDSKGQLTSVELGASAFLLQTTRFRAGNLTRVPAGFPKQLSGLECLTCFEKQGHVDVMSSCHVELETVYPPGELTVAVKTTDGPFKTLCDSFSEVNGSKFYFGMGDLTGNGNRRAIFLFSNTTAKRGQKVLRYMEYGNQKHSNALKDLAQERKGIPVDERTVSEVAVWNISCDVNELSFGNFLQAMMVYRTIQLENPVYPSMFDDEKERFAAISPDDVYRAGLSMKIIDDDAESEPGSYYLYTSCGTYKWKFLAPLLTCLALIVGLGLFSTSCSSRSIVNGVPYNSRSWFKHARRQALSEEGNTGDDWSGYFDRAFDEIILERDASGSGNPRVVFQSNTRRRRSERSSQNTTDQSVSQEYDDPFDEPFEEPFG